MNKNEKSKHGLTCEIEDGFRPRVKGKIQQYMCDDCGKAFTDVTIVELAVKSQYEGGDDDDF